MRLAERIIKNRSYWLITFALWSALVVISASWNIEALTNHAYMMARERGKNYFQMIQLTRQWNAEHGPVYVPVTEQTPPNPYLNIDERDITTSSGRALTVVNPAYMTRQMSELAEKNRFYFHLTSLNPIRPKNQADAWETEALKSFHNGNKESIEVVQIEERAVFRYMAPLQVKAACLPCHAQQGYMIGDIRGGISVNIDADEIFGSLDEQKLFVIVIHAVAWTAVSLLLFIFLDATRKHTLFLEGINYAKQKDLQKHRAELDRHKQDISDLVTRDTTTGLHTAEHFKQLSSMLWNNAIKYGNSVSFLLLEIDYFTDYNENYGALEGDMALKQVSAAISDTIDEKGSIMARFGGASSIVMLTGRDAGEAYDIAQQVHGAVLSLAIPHETSEVSRYLTITAGVTTVQPKHGDFITDVVQRLRSCLAKGIKKGRNRIYRC